jgi:hypothetical protein
VQPVEYQFMAVTDELSEYYAKDGRYPTVRAAGLIRQLFLDMVQLVNQARGIEVKFVVRAAPPMVDRLVAAGVPVPLISLDEPGPVANDPLVEVNEDVFFARQCLFIEGERYSIGELVKACANKEGGVHYDATVPKDRGTKLRAWAYGLELGGRQTDVHLMRDIMKCVMAALEPLVGAVRSGQ